VSEQTSTSHSTRVTDHLEDESFQATECTGTELWAGNIAHTGEKNTSASAAFGRFIDLTPPANCEYDSMHTNRPRTAGG